MKVGQYPTADREAALDSTEDMKVGQYPTADREVALDSTEGMKLDQPPTAHMVADQDYLRN